VFKNHFVIPEVGGSNSLSHPFVFPESRVWSRFLKFRGVQNARSGIFASSCKRYNATPGDGALPADDWIAEAGRRSAAYDAGEMTVAPWSEVRRRVNRAAGRDD